MPKRGAWGCYVFEERYYFNHGWGELETRTSFRSTSEASGEGGNGHTTTYTYDAMGRRLTERADPDAFPNEVGITYTYDALGRVVGEIDELGNATAFEYDPVGRRTKVTDALSNETKFTYDANGNRLSMTDANGHLTEYQYDAFNRQINTVYHSGEFTRSEYDALGRRVAEIDEAGRRTEYGYDALGRLIEIRQEHPTENWETENWTITRYAYDEAGNRVSQTDANGHVTRMEYDSAGRRSKLIRPNGDTETYTYDGFGNLAHKIDFNGHRIDYEYDGMDRMTAIDVADTHPSLALPHATDRVEFSYDEDGRRGGHTMRTVSGTVLHEETYLYDARGRLAEKQSPQGNLVYRYNAVGHLTDVESSNLNGLDVRYEYDALNRLAVVEDEGFVPPAVTEYSYDPVGNLENVAYANGVTHIWAYDSRNRLTDLNIHHVIEGAIQSYNYTLNAKGYRTAVVELSGRTSEYTYDNLYRLTEESITAGTADPAPSGTVAYTLDPVGNRLSRNSGLGGIATQSFTYNENDHLGAESYDAAGNVVDSTATNAEGGADSYDFMNRLIRRQKANGTVVDLVYNADGVRVRKRVTPVSGSTTEVAYLIDANNMTGYPQVVERLTSGGTVTAVHTFGLDLISRTTINGAIAETRYYLYDGLGRVRALTDDIGQVTDEYYYDAFGNVLHESGAADNPYRYTGEFYDQDLGQYYLRARYLNTNTGRFNRVDPFEGGIQDPVSLHRYLYGNANPVMFVDPSGNVSLASINFAVIQLGIWASRVAVPSAFVLNRAATRIGNSNLAWAIRSSTNGIWLRSTAIFSRRPAILETGIQFEKFLNPFMTRLGGVAQKTIQVGATKARPDWIFNNVSIVDAKLGQTISSGQFNVFLQWASARGGSITYVTLTRVPPAIKDPLIKAGEAAGVVVNFITLTPVK